jgi:signal transduction histidine kinase
MKEHNGNVEAANAPGGGAVFTVTLPTATHS